MNDQHDARITVLSDDEIDAVGGGKQSWSQWFWGLFTTETYADPSTYVGGVKG